MTSSRPERSRMPAPGGGRPRRPASTKLRSASQVRIRMTGRSAPMLRAKEPRYRSRQTMRDAQRQRCRSEAPPTRAALVHRRLPRTSRPGPRTYRRFAVRRASPTPALSSSAHGNGVLASFPAFARNSIPVHTLLTNTARHHHERAPPRRALAFIYRIRAARLHAQAEESAALFRSGLHTSRWGLTSRFGYSPKHSTIAASRKRSGVALLTLGGTCACGPVRAFTRGSAARHAAPRRSRPAAARPTGARARA